MIRTRPDDLTLASVRDPDAVVAWLYRIETHVCYDRFRRWARPANQEGDAEDLLLHLGISRLAPSVTGLLGPVGSGAATFPRDVFRMLGQAELRNR